MSNELVANNTRKAVVGGPCLRRSVDGPEQQILSNKVFRVHIWTGLVADVTGDPTTTSRAEAADIHMFPSSARKLYPVSPMHVIQTYRACIQSLYASRPSSPDRASIFKPYGARPTKVTYSSYLELFRQAEGSGQTLGSRSSAQFSSPYSAKKTHQDVSGIQDETTIQTDKPELFSL